MKCPWFCLNLSRKNFVNANGLLSPVISLYVLRSISCNSKSFSCSFFFNASISRFTSESSPSFSGISSYFRNLESQAIPGLSLFTHFCCNFFWYYGLYVVFICLPFTNKMLWTNATIKVRVKIFPAYQMESIFLLSTSLLGTT